MLLVISYKLYVSWHPHDVPSYKPNNGSSSLFILLIPPNCDFGIVKSPILTALDMDKNPPSSYPYCNPNRMRFLIWLVISSGSPSIPMVLFAALRWCWSPAAQPTVSRWLNAFPIPPILLATAKYFFRPNILGGWSGFLWNQHAKIGTEKFGLQFVWLTMQGIFGDFLFHLWTNNTRKSFSPNRRTLHWFTRMMALQHDQRWEFCTISAYSDLKAADTNG